MEQISRALPLRLIPTKGHRRFRIVYLMVFFGAALFSFAEFDPWRMLTLGPLGYAAVLLVTLVLALLVWSLVSGMAKALPGRSPLNYLEIAPEGLVRRQPGSIERFAWADLSRFDVHVEIHIKHDADGNEIDSRYDYYVIAVAAADEALLQDDEKCFEHAVFRFAPDVFGAGGEEADAKALADWLNEIRADALANAGRARAAVTVPPEFRDSVVAPTPPPSGAAPAARSRAVER
jgi:hypothetical protein